VKYETYSIKKETKWDIEWLASPLATAKSGHHVCPSKGIAKSAVLFNKSTNVGTFRPHLEIDAKYFYRGA